jgi:hypothetical protein
MNEPNENKKDSDLGSLYDAIQSGSEEDITRLMSADIDDNPDEKEEKEPKPQESGDTQESDDTADADNASEEEVDTKDTKDSESVKNDSDKPTEAAPPAASNPSATDTVESLKAQIEELRQLNHRYSSDAGRVPYLQRRLAELERQTRAPQQARSVNQVQEGKTAPVSADDLKNIELDPEMQRELDDLKDVDPVMAKALERSHKMAILTAQRRAEAMFQERDNIQTQIEDEKFYLEQKAELDRMIPQNPQIFQSQEWHQWKAGLTPGQRALAESGYASEVAQAIYAFAADMKSRLGTAEKPAEEKQPPSAPSEVAEARARKAESSPEVKNPSAKTDRTPDEDQMFREFYKQIGKETHIL